MGQADPKRAVKIAPLILAILAGLGLIALVGSGGMVFLPQSQTLETVRKDLAVLGVGLIYPWFIWTSLSAIRRRKSVLSIAVAAFVALCAPAYVCIGIAYALGVDMRATLGMDVTVALMLLAVPMIVFYTMAKPRNPSRPPR